MRAQLIRHMKLGNIVEVKLWQLSEPTKDSPHGHKYSLVYIVDGERVMSGSSGTTTQRTRETTGIAGVMSGLINSTA